MNLKLRPLEDLSQAREILDLLELGVRETSLTYREDPVENGTAASFLGNRFADPETLIVLGRVDPRARALGLCR